MCVTNNILKRFTHYYVVVEQLNKDVLVFNTETLGKTDQIFDYMLYNSPEVMIPFIRDS